ncbi:TerB family tellurite resistance protein [candidate division FCPU426 bacterium]|nr:TerB family tellurite resistance protein [candidate division FCPU426 bacterium]
MGILERFAQIVHRREEHLSPALTYRVVLGALLSLVSRADGRVTPAEMEAKREILAKNGYPDAAEQTEILTASQRAVEERLDWEGFTREVNKQCDYAERVKLVRALFTVAWADHELTPAEVETIRKVANLLWLDHSDFIKAKLETKPKGRA